MGNICLYRHIRLDTNTTFYIGIGNKKRPYIKSTRSNYWKNVTNKTDYETEILKTNLTWEEACELEIALISYYGRRDLGEGTLVNLTEGGEGSQGVIVSLKTRLKLSKIHSKPVINMDTLEIFKSIKYINTDINKSYLNSMLNNNRTNITPFKYLKDRYNDDIKYNELKKTEAKGVSVIDTVTGKIYKSVAKAARENKLNQHTLYSYLSNKRTNKTNLIFYEK